MTPLLPQSTRIAVTPEWVGLLDFEQRWPTAIETAMVKAQAASAGASD